MERLVKKHVWSYWQAAHEFSLLLFTGCKTSHRSSCDKNPLGWHRLETRTPFFVILIGIVVRLTKRNTACRILPKISSIWPYGAFLMSLVPGRLQMPRGGIKSPHVPMRLSEEVESRCVFSSCVKNPNQPDRGHQNHSGSNNFR